MLIPSKAQVAAPMEKKFHLVQHIQAVTYSQTPRRVRDRIWDAVRVHGRMLSLRALFESSVIEEARERL